MRPAVLSLALLLLGSSCGYSTSSRTAKGIKSVFVEFFENRTPEPNLEIAVTERIVDFLIADNTLKVLSESQADALLQGAIVTFRNFPFSFDEELNAQEYQVVVEVDVSLYDRKLNEPIWQNQRIRGIGSYFLEAVAPVFTYEDALAEAVEQITDRILNLTVQDW
jgi:hypothetical protein